MGLQTVMTKQKAKRCAAPKDQKRSSRTAQGKGQRIKVYVLNMRGQPLMPCSPAKARHLLKAERAVVKSCHPFTIQLTMATGQSKQPIKLGVDPGYEHAGFSASTEKEEVFACTRAMSMQASRPLPKKKRSSPAPSKCAPISLNY